MSLSSEFVGRVLRKRAAHDPALETDQREVARIFREAMRDPAAYVTDDEDRAFMMLGHAVETARREIMSAEDAQADLEEGDPTEYEARVRGAEGPDDPWLTGTLAELRHILQVDPHCYDARTILVMSEATDDEDAIARLLALQDECRDWCASRSAELDKESDDDWDAIFMRPYLRLLFKIADLFTLSGRYRLSLARHRAMLAENPTDHQGVRHGAALLLARLEDEEGLDALDVAYGRSGSAWMALSRAVLLYKLGRMDAARRATEGLASLYPAAAYFLVEPPYVEPYVTERPPFAPGSPREALLATFEAQFLLDDTPVFVDWALTLPGFTRAAEEFGRSHGGEY